MAADDQDFVVLGDSDVRDFNDAGLLPLSDKEIGEIHAWLKPTDYAAGSSEYAKHKASHLAGTGAWILETDEYRKWHDSDHGALWIKAIAGAGKSVLAASVVSKLSSEEQVPVLYFFFRHIISANQKPQSLIRDYLSQLLPNSPWLQHALYKPVDAERSLESMSLSELWDMLVTALTQLPRVYCVVDALDEMDSGKQSFLEDLIALGQKAPSQVKILMTSRPVPRVEQILHHPDVLQIGLQPRMVDPDISIYVRHRANQCPVSDELRSLIHRKMCTKANGHFLYARLMMDDISDPSKNTLASEETVLSVLDSLPTPMADMYTKMLLDHSRRSRVPQEVQVAILCWITRAERPLRLLELCSIFDTKQKAVEISKDTKTIVREACGPLVEIFEDETVHPIHHSFTEYLYDSSRRTEGSEPLFPVLDYSNAQRTLSLSCIKYLKSIWGGGVDAESIDRSKCGHEDYQRSQKLKYPFLGYAASNLCSHLRKYDSEDAVINAELDALLIESPDFLMAWLEMTKPQQSYFARVSDGTRFQYWTVLHAAADQGLTHYAGHLIAMGHPAQTLVIKDSAQELSGFYDDDPVEDKSAPAELAAKSGYSQVLEILLNAGVPHDHLDDLGMTFLHHAALQNHALVAELLLSRGADAMAKRTKDYPGRRCGNSPSAVGDTPVKYACTNGHLEVMKAMIPYLDTESLQTALYHALKYGKSRIAKALLHVPGVDVNATVRGKTPLYLAAKQRDVDLLGLLISMGAQSDELKTKSEPASQFIFRYGGDGYVKGLLNTFACSGGSQRDNHEMDWARPETKEAFELLLAAGADINLTGADGSSVLHTLVADGQFASKKEPRNGIEIILSFLLERGLSATLLTKDGSNALHCASHIPAAAIDLLLEHGVDINHARSSDGKTPFMTAVEKNDLFLVQCLIDRGANVHVKDFDYNSPLHLISNLSDFQIDYDMVKLLLRAGSDVHSRNKSGNTPMHHRDLKLKLLALFREYGFDLESKNKEGYTVLHQSLLSNLYQGPHERSIEIGANYLTTDSQGRNILHTLLSRNSIDRSTKEFMEFIVEKGVDPLATDILGNNLWHFMAGVGASYHQDPQLAIMQLLMQYKVSPTARNLAGQTPIHAAFSVDVGHYPYGAIEFLLEKTQVDIDCADYNGIVPIHSTASFDIGLTHRLLQLGADAAKVTIEGQNALMIACRNRQCNTVCMILDHYRDHDLLALVDHVDKLGRTALHYACKSGRPESVAALIDAGAQVGLKDKQGNTPLDLCSEYLIEDQLWRKAVEANVSHSGLKAANILLTDDSRPKLSQYSMRPVPTRVRETVRLLIANGADTSFLTEKSKPISWSLPTNPLALSLKHSCEAMTSELLIIQDRLLRSNATDEDSSRRSSAAQYEQMAQDINTFNLRCYHSLDRFENLRKLSQVDRSGKLAAETAEAGKDNVNLVRQLLEVEAEPAVAQMSEIGANFLELDNGGDSALFEMTSLGYTDLLRRVGQDACQMTASWVLEKAPQNVNWREDRLRCILYRAVDRDLPNLDMVKLLVTEFKLDVNEVFLLGSSYQKIRGSFVHLLAESRSWWQIKALDFLLRNGAQVDLPSSEGETALIMALRAANTSLRSPVTLKMMEILLRHGASPNAVDKDGKTCLNLAGGQLPIVKLLLQHGADLTVGSQPFIFDAIRAQNVEIVRCITESGVDVNCRAQTASIPDPADTKRKGHRWIHPNRLGERTVVREEDICKHGYPIHLAASHILNTTKAIDKASQIIEMLLKAGADPFRKYDYGDSVLHALAEQNGIIKPFVRLPGFDTEARDSQGRTLLLAACDSPSLQNRDCAVAPWDVILEAGGSVQATDNDGRSALHHLLRKDFNPAHKDLVNKLTPRLVLVPDNQGRTPFHYALSTKKFEFLNALLDNGADPLVADPSDRSTALHHLAPSLSRIDHELIRRVAELYREGDPPPKEIDSILELSQTRVHFNHLSARGLLIDAEDSTGETPLFKVVRSLAKLHMDRYRDGSFEERIWQSTFGIFESAGADFLHRNQTGESLLHKLALQRGASDHFLRRHPDNDSHALLTDTWSFLVNKGVDVRWEDEGHRTCLDVAAVAGSQWVLDIYKRK